MAGLQEFGKVRFGIYLLGTFLLCTVAGLISVSSWYAASVQNGDGSSWLDMFIEYFPDFMIIWLFSPLILWITRIIPLTTLGPTKTIVLHLAVSFSGGLLHQRLTRVWDYLVRGDLSTTDLVNHLLTDGLRATFVMIYFAIVFAILSWRYYAEAQQQQVDNTRLERELLNSRLAQLRARMNPHFLFNTLQAVDVIIGRGDRSQARSVIDRLGYLLRKALKTESTHMVPLSEELHMVDAYLEIERIRLGERLKVKTAVSADVLAWKVPTFILQPLIENAVIHGISRTASGGLMTIEARRVEGKLGITIIDNGPGFSQDAEEGIGLASVRDRLKLQYGEAARMMVDSTEKETRVDLLIPQQEEESRQ